MKMGLLHTEEKTKGVGVFHWNCSSVGPNLFLSIGGWLLVSGTFSGRQGSHHLWLNVDWIKAVKKPKHWNWAKSEWQQWRVRLNCSERPLLYLLIVAAYVKFSKGFGYSFCDQLNAKGWVTLQNIRRERNSTFFFFGQQMPHSLSLHL